MEKTGNRPPIDPGWMTKKALAIYLGVSQRFIDMHIRPYVNVYRPNHINGRKILFDRKEVDDLIRRTSSDVTSNKE